MVRRGLGDTIVPRAAITRQGSRGLHFVSFADPLYDTFSFIARSDGAIFDEHDRRQKHGERHHEDPGHQTRTSFSVCLEEPTSCQSSE
jgi:hypothetical protein